LIKTLKCAQIIIAKGRIDMGERFDVRIFTYLFLFINAMLILSCPLIILIAISEYPIITDENILSSVKLIIALVSCVVFVFLIYVSQIAAKYKIESDMTFWNSNRAAFGTARINLSYLPIIGIIFKRKE
jgi:hypothetical protein